MLLLLPVLFLVCATSSPAAPANDSFAQAQQLNGEEDELPGEITGSSKEPGEPDHAGNPGGASVWYSWTAPDFQLMFVRVCSDAGWPPLVGVYRGDALRGLVSVASSPLAPDECQRLHFRAVSGVAYRIAVDGFRAPDESTPATGTFTLRLALIRLTGPPKALSPANDAAATAFAPPTIPDARPPNTYIRKRLRARRGRVGFKLDASELEPEFFCRLDKRPFKPCVSPVIYRRLSRGWHRLFVRATDRAGNVDPTPATRRFRVGARR